MFYTPLLSDGTIVPLAWQIKTFYYNIGWPLKDNPKRWMQLLYRFVILFTFILYFCLFEFEFHYVRCNINDLSLWVQAFVSLITLFEHILRMGTLVLKQHTLKAFMTEFFRDIYVDGNRNPGAWAKIRQELMPCTVFSYGYLIALAGYVLVPIIQKEPFPFKIILPYSYDDRLVYGITLVCIYWIPYTVVLSMIGDSYFFATCVLHLNQRYHMEEKEIQLRSLALIEKASSSSIASEYRKDIINMYVRICNLNRFADKLNSIYEARIFVMFLWGTIILCMLLVLIASFGPTPDNMIYVNWIVAKVMEMFIFGLLGSTLIKTTDSIGSMYYLSNWEEILYRSTNRMENIRLLKDLNIMMSLQRNPMRLTGLGFFVVSLDTAIAVIRGSFSFYTCLKSVNEIPE